MNNFYIFFFITKVYIATVIPTMKILKVKKKPRDSEESSHLPNVRGQGRFLSIYFAMSLYDATDLVIIVLARPG